MSAPKRPQSGDSENNISPTCVATSKSSCMSGISFVFAHTSYELGEWLQTPPFCSSKGMLLSETLSFEVAQRNSQSNASETCLVSCASVIAEAAQKRWGSTKTTTPPATREATYSPQGGTRPGTRTARRPPESSHSCPTCTTQCSSRRSPRGGRA